MKMYLKLRSFQIVVISLIVLMLVFSTSDIMARDRFWNLIRMALAFVSGFIFLFVGVWFLFKNLLSKMRFAFKFVIGVLLSPVFAVVCFLMFGFSMCSFRAPLEGFPGHQEKVRQTRIFIDYIGDQGALGFSAMGVYHDAPVFGSNDFLKTVLICENESKYASIDFVVVDENQIECVHESGKKERFDLPL
jgi:hypothetical protein